MKKLGLLVMPLMTVSLLASCGGNSSKKPTTTYNVVFYAGDGSYSEGKTIWISNVAPGTKLLPLLKDIETPILEGNTFAYYEYGNKSNAIGYDDVVTSNILLKANYFDSSVEQTYSLTSFDWRIIKNIAVTGDPSRWFYIGATKEVEVNKKDHEVRIIDFNHDNRAGGSSKAGITFEFANVITQSGGSADTSAWNKEGDFTNYKYSESTLHNFLNVGENSVFNKLPDDLKADGMVEEVYKPVAETTESDFPSYEINTSFTTKLFPLSRAEISESYMLGETEEGTSYAFYDYNSGREKRIKKEVDGSEGKMYWLRSPSYINSKRNYAWAIIESGEFIEKSISNEGLSVAPAFCI